MPLVELRSPVFGATFFRPLKRAVGDWGCANPQPDDWGYHLTPAQAGFSAGFPDPGEGADLTRAGCPDLGKQTHRDGGCPEVSVLGPGPQTPGLYRLKATRCSRSEFNDARSTVRGSVLI
jgi:hypothetical protein